MQTLLRVRRERSPAAAGRSGDSPLMDPRELAARCRRIQAGWTEAERDRRAYTARVVQLLLVGPPVGFRLAAE